MGRAGRSSGGGGSRSSGGSGGSRSRSSSRSSRSCSSSFSSSRSCSSSGSSSSWDDDNDGIVIYEAPQVDPATYHILTEEEFNNKKRNIKIFSYVIYVIIYLYFNLETFYDIIFQFDVSYLSQDIQYLLAGHVSFAILYVVLKLLVFNRLSTRETYEDYMKSDIVRKAKFQQAFDDIEQWHEKEVKDIGDPNE